MMQAVRHVDGAALWANLHLLFWLSLLPFATAWLGASGFARWPAMLHGADLLLCAAAYFLLQWRLVLRQGRDGALARAIGRDPTARARPRCCSTSLGWRWRGSPIRSRASPFSPSSRWSG